MIPSWAASLLIAYENLSARTRSARNLAADATAEAGRALALSRQVAESAYWQRLTSIGVTDFLLGIAGPLLSASKPGPLASALDGACRPGFSEATAARIEPWPGRRGQYEPSGSVRAVPNGHRGQNFAVGLLLTFPEVRAFLMGLAQPAQPSPALTIQYFRAAQGLAMALAELAMGGELAQAAYTAAWRRLFAASASCPTTAFQPAVPGSWHPVPTTYAEALNQIIARIVALETAAAAGPTWTFAGSAPLLGEGWYVSGPNTLTRALASAAAGPAAADADGVYDGSPGHLGSTSGAVYHVRLEPGSSPVPGQFVYTSYTTAGLFTTVEPAGGSGNYNAVRGKIEDVTGHDPLDPTGSPVLAVWRPTVEVGPV